MTTMTRSDIHRPGSDDFDPEGYDFFGVFDLNTSASDWMGPTPAATVSRLVDEGWSFRGAPHGSGQCSHCGTRIRYAALMGHVATKTLMYIGETCLDNTFSLTKGEFDALRAGTAANRERNSKQARIAALVEEYPVLAWASYAHNIDVAGGVKGFYVRDDYEGTEYATEDEARATLPEWQRDDFYAVGEGFRRGTTWGEKTRTGWETSTLQDIWHKVQRYGDVSVKQVNFVGNLVDRLTQAEERLAERESKAAALAAEGVEVPTGRIVVEGEVVSTKWVDNQYGGSLKMLVKNDEGWKVWGSVPSSIEVEKGTRVRFTATVEQSNDDSLFGFFKRPAKAEVL